MTQEATYYPALKTWWDNAEFNGKEFCQLKENGELVLKGTPHYPEKVIASLTPENADAVLKALIEKFPEVEGRVKEVETEWNSSEDKLKLIGKVSRTREYLLHTNAIGDFDALVKEVSGW